MKKMNKKGFTIVELVIVITVIAILSAVMIPTFTGIVKRAKDSAVLQNAKNAYTEYLSSEDFDYAETDKATLYMTYEKEGRFAVVVAGELKDTIFSGENAEANAKAALGLSLREDSDNGTPDDTTDDIVKNYTVEEKGGFKIYTVNE